MQTLALLPMENFRQFTLAPHLFHVCLLYQRP